MAKTLGLDLHEPMDHISAREERRATGRMVAVIVALLMIFLGFYHAWIKKIPVLAGVMVPALIMLLYAAWVMFLAKREKIRRLNAENQLRDSVSALSEVLIVPPDHSISPDHHRRNRRESHDKSYIGLQHTCKHGNPKCHHHKRRKDHQHHHHHRRQHKPTCEFYDMQKSTIKRKLLPLPPELVLLTQSTRHQDSDIRRPSLVRSRSAL